MTIDEYETDPCSIEARVWAATTPNEGEFAGEFDCSFIQNYGDGTYSFYTEPMEDPAG